MKKTTILITDDHTLVRETWSYILNNEPGLEVIAEAGSAEEAIEAAKKLRPDIVIMDISLPGLNGIEAIKQIHKFSPASKVLGVSLYSQPSYARKMIQIGAMGYVTKNSPRHEMFEAIKEIQKGKKYICQEIKNIISEQVINGSSPQAGLNTLSQREIEIILHLKNGDSSREIAEALCIAVKTVEVHRYNILKKLNLKNTAALINHVNNRLDLLV